MTSSHIRRTAVLTLSAAALAITSACFGSFNLTRNLWKFNKDVSKNKFAQEVVFLGMNIVPVYGVVSFIDVVILNSVEFWTGENPVKVASRTRLDDGTVVQRVVYEKDGVRAMSLKTFQADTLVSATTMNFVPGTEQLAFKTTLAGGRTVSRVVAIDSLGHPYLFSASDTVR